MKQFTLDDLRRILREHSGDAGTLDGDIADVSFTDLGYDSLSVVDLASQIEHEYDVSIPEPELRETPAAIVAYVNEQLSAKA